MMVFVYIYETCTALIDYLVTLGVGRIHAIMVIVVVVPSSTFIISTIIIITTIIIVIIITNDYSIKVLMVARILYLW